MGKGSRYRPTDQKKYDEGWLKVFGVACPSCHGQKIQFKLGPPCGFCKGTGKVSERERRAYYQATKRVAKKLGVRP